MGTMRSADLDLGHLAIPLNRVRRATAGASIPTQ